MLFFLLFWEFFFGCFGTVLWLFWGCFMVVFRVVFGSFWFNNQV